MDKDKQLLTKGLDLSLEELGEIYKAGKSIIWEGIKATFPVICGIEAYKREKLHEIEEQRLTTFIKATQDKEKYLGEEKIDKEFLKTEEFARMVFNILEKVKNDYREEKLKYYSNILVNYSTIDFSDDFYKEGIIDRLSKYSVEHIVVLKFIYDNKGYIDINNIPQMQGLDSNIVKICIAELFSDSLLKNFDGRAGDKIFLGDFSGKYFITDYGKKMINLISEEKNNIKQFMIEK